MKTKLTAIGLGLAMSATAGIAQAATSCGMNSGEAATGKPILVGGIHGNAAPGDFSASTQAAAAYFKCVNANGGINGRPIEYLVENDQWNPELAAQAAAKLQHPNIVGVIDRGTTVDGKRPYIAFEFVDGETASELLRSAGGKLPEREALVLEDANCRPRHSRRSAGRRRS